jgi:tetratricopeptide (TPR) repeat protein
MKQKKQIKPPLKKKPEVPGNRTSKQKNIKNLLGIIIAVFAFLLYAQSISYNYTLDDIGIIKESKIIKQGLVAIPTILKSDYLNGVTDDLRGPNYRPASLVMFAIEWQFFPGNPHAGHFMNVLLFAITCLILFLLLCKLFEDQNFIFPFVCTLLFCAHPIHTEVVNNIKSRDEILYFLFGITAVFLAIRSIERKSILLLILSAFCYFISLLSKESAISFLILIPLVLFVFTKSDFKKILNISMVLVAVSGVYFFIRFHVLAPLPDIHWNSAVMNNSLNGAPDFIGQKATAMYILLRYILLLIFPHPLTYDYSFAQIPIQKIMDPAALLAIIIYFAIGIYAVLKIRTRSLVAFAILFYLIALAPVSNVFMLIGSPMAERFLYVPSLGFCILLTFFLIRITKTERFKNKFVSFKQFIFSNSVFVFVFILVGVYSLKTYSRNPDWKDNITLFGHDIQSCENSARAHFNWGTEILNVRFPKEHDKEKQNDLLDQVIVELNKSNAIYNNEGVYLILSNVYFEKQDFPSALKNNQTAKELSQKPNPKVNYNFSRIYERIGQLERSLAYADSAINNAPNISFSYNQKGVVLSKLIRYDDAILAFKKCIELDPEFVMAYKNTGICYLNLKQGENALEFFNKAMAMNPADPSYTNLIASARQNIGDLSKIK